MPPDVDPATGRLRPQSAEERAGRSRALASAVGAIRRTSDETDADVVWDDVMRGVDRARPHRPLFFEGR